MSSIRKKAIFRLTWLTALTAVGVMVLGTGLASASHIRGVRATLDGAPDPDSLEVDIFFTQYNAGGEGTPKISDYRTYYIGKHSVPYFIDWGDGETEYTVTLHLDSTFTDKEHKSDIDVWRGSFSHTYPNSDPRTITVFSTQCCAPNPSNFSSWILTGNFVGESEDPRGYKPGYLTNTLAVTFPSPTTTVVCNPWHDPGCPFTSGSVFAGPDGGNPNHDINPDGNIHHRPTGDSSASSSGCGAVSTSGGAAAAASALGLSMIVAGLALIRRRR